MKTSTTSAPSTRRGRGRAPQGERRRARLAGGMTLLPTMKLRLAQPSRPRRSWRASPSCAASSSSGERLVIGAMTRHAEVAASADVQQRHPGARGARRRRSATRRCAIAARSAARSRTTIRRPTTRRRCSPSTPRCRPTGARSRPSSSSPACSRPRSRPASSSRRSSSRSRSAPPTRSSRIPPRATRWSACMVADFGGEVRVAVTGAGAGVFRVAAFEAALKQNFAPEALAGLERARRRASTATCTAAPSTARTWSA